MYTVQNASVQTNSDITTAADANHALLADPTRRAILRALGLAARPVDAHSLAASLGLHVNSVRDQLHRLEAAGRVAVTPAPAAGRGRPRVLYALDPRGGYDPHRALVLGLVDQLAATADGPSIGQAAGRRWGETEANAQQERGPATASLGDALTTMLVREGFVPVATVPDASGGLTLALRACPYLPLAPQQLRIVCGVHLGYLEGAVLALGATTSTVTLEPFAEPAACLAHVRSSGDPADV